MRVLGLDASSPLWPLTTGDRDGPAPGEATIGEATIDKIRSDPGNAWPPDIHIQGGREMLEQFVGSSWLDESLGPLLDSWERPTARGEHAHRPHGRSRRGLNRRGGVYEGGVRVPLLLHWPARPRAEASALRGAHYLTHLDLLPTLVARGRARAHHPARAAPSQRDLPWEGHVGCAVAKHHGTRGARS